MAGCLKALGFWRKKSKNGAAAGITEKPRTQHAPSNIHNPEKPPLEVQHVRVAPASRGVPIRPTVNPVYSAYSTPVDTRWADSATSTKAPYYSADDGTKLEDDGVVDPEEDARRRKAAQEEQERLDFFQMM
jgi:hypothetical protein